MHSAAAGSVGDGDLATGDLIFLVFYLFYFHFTTLARPFCMYADRSFWTSFFGKPRKTRRTLLSCRNKRVGGSVFEDGRVVFVARPCNVLHSV